MFFILSKIIWFLLAPLNLMTICIVVGVIFNRLQKLPVARGFLGFGFAILLIFGIFPSGVNALNYLETRTSKPITMPLSVKGIVILGGAVESRSSELSHMTEFNDAVDRVNAAMILSRQYPEAKIVFSGGSGKLVKDERVDSVDMKIYLRNIGFKSSHVIYEDHSRTTWENLLNSKTMLKPQERENWLLVTSAWHMPRALGVARKLGWGLIPYPVDYRGPGRYLLIPEKFDVLENFYMGQLALREIIGILAYRLSGKI